MHLEIVEALDFSLDPLVLADVKEHLRVKHDFEDDYITRLMKTSLRRAERVTQRSLIPQQKILVLDGFPCWGIEIPAPPLLSVDEITYIDADGNEQTMGGSPAEYVVSKPSGPTAKPGSITPAYGTTWPVPRYQPDAVRVTFTAGYAAIGSPPTADIPEDITHGRLLLIAEMYKQRSESIIGQGVTTNPALIRARELWLAYKAY